MSFVGDMLFGDEGEPSRIEDLTPAQFRRLRTPVANQVTRLLRGGTQPPAESREIVPLGQREQALLDQAFGTTANPFTATGRETLTRTAQGEFLSPDSNPFLTATIEAAQRPIRQAFEEQVLPNLRTEFTRAGQFIQGTGQGESGSSPFDETQRRASRDLLNTLSDISTRVVSENFQRERERQQEAAAAAPAFTAQELDNLVKNLQAQALPRLIEQEGIDRGLQLFQQGLDNLLQILRIGGTLASPQTELIPGTPGTPGLIPTVASGFAAGAGLGLGQDFNPFAG